MDGFATSPYPRVWCTRMRRSRPARRREDAMTELRRPSPHPAPDSPVAASPAEAPRGPGRRGFLGWVLAGPTLAVAAPLVAASTGGGPAGAVVPSPPEPADLYDLGDLQDSAALATSHLVKVVIREDGTAAFALPRTEVGQGITTSSAMLIAEELDLPLEKV